MELHSSQRGIFHCFLATPLGLPATFWDRAPADNAKIRKPPRDTNRRDGAAWGGVVAEGASRGAGAVEAGGGRATSCCRCSWWGGRQRTGLQVRREC